MAMAGALQWLRDHTDELTEEDVVVVIMPDGGYRALGKVFNDVWMQEHGFLEAIDALTAEGLVRQRPDRPAGPQLVSVPSDMILAEAIEVMREHAISQAPVTRDGNIVGSLVDQEILRWLIAEPDARARLVQDIMGDPFPIVAGTSSIQHVAAQLEEHGPAVLVRQSDGDLSIVTRSDLIATLGA